MFRRHRRTNQTKRNLANQATRKSMRSRKEHQAYIKRHNKPRYRVKKKRPTLRRLQHRAHANSPQKLAIRG